MPGPGAPAATCPPPVTPRTSTSSSRAGAAVPACAREGRERRVEFAAAGLFLAVAVAMALALSSPRHLEPVTLAILLVAYVVASRAKFDISDGYAVPTELVLVPMLFLLPTPVVPLVVAASWVLARLIDAAVGARQRLAQPARGRRLLARGRPGAGADRRRRPDLRLGRLADLPRRARRPAPLRLRHQRGPRLADRRHPAVDGAAAGRPGLRARRGAGPGRGDGGVRRGGGRSRPRPPGGAAGDGALGALGRAARRGSTRRSS